MTAYGPDPVLQKNPPLGVGELYPIGLKLNLGSFLNLFTLEFQKSGVLTMSEHTGNDERRKCLLIGIVGSDSVIESLPGKGNLVPVLLSSSCRLAMF